MGEQQTQAVEVSVPVHDCTDLEIAVAVAPDDADAHMSVQA